MADKNVPAPAPTRSDDQILPFAVAFTASASLDEDWFTLDVNLLREALKITPIDQAHLFMSPPLGDAIMDFMNELGYQEMLWGIITSTNVDYAELMWEEFVQTMQTFLTDKDNLGSPTKKGRKDKPHAIPYCRFTKLIICHLGRIHNIHQRSASPFHLAEEDLRLSNLKFVSKGEIDEVFGMPIPNELTSNNIRNASYYNAYLEMVVKHDQKVASEKEGKKKSASTKQPKPKPAIVKSSKPVPAPKPKVTKEKTSKASTANPPKPKPAKEKSTKATPLQKAGKAHSEPEPEPEQEGASEEYDMEHAIQMSLESFQAQGHAHVRGVAIQEPVVEAIRPLLVVEGNEASTRPSTQPLDDTYANIIRDYPSSADAETGARSDKTSSGGDTEIVQVTEELGEDVEKQEKVEEKTMELDQDQAGSDPGETLESRPQPEQVYMEEVQAGPDHGISRVALGGPDPEPTHNEFMVDLYPKDAYAIGDQFINDKSTDDEPIKLNVEAEVVFMVTVPIYQASSSVPPLSTPVIDLSPPKPASSTTQTPIFIATTMTTTPLLPPPQQQSTTESELVERVAALEKKLSDLEQTNKNLDNTTRNLGSRVYTLELRDLSHKINEAVCENVKEAVQIALQAPLRDRFRDLSEEDMKEMLHQRMFETGSYKSLPEHIALYEALEASMERAQRDEFLTEKDKSFDDILIQDSDNISDSEETDSAYLPKTKQRPEWLKPIPDDERPATSEPAWVIPTSHILDVVNNWANALATTYQALTENSLLEKTGDMRTFMNWYCQKMGKAELTQADLEDQAYEVVKPFYLDVVHLQFQMEECHKMLTDQIEWANPEGDQVRIDISKHLPLSGPPGHLNHLPSSDIRMLSTVVKPWTRNLVIRQRVEDFQLGIESYQKQLNLTKPRWDATHFEFKHDYTIIDSPCVVVFPITLDYRVKKYKVNRLNSGMDTWFWTDKDVERSKEFIHAIERSLKTRSIFRNLECFVGGRVRDIDYRLLLRTE
ncbi:hypothetical protein Tco_1504286 [Tanacetum coccineum]